MAHWKLKIEEQFADEIVSGMKTFEVRKEDDKVFQKGDSVEFVVNPVKLIGGGLPDAYLALTEDHPINGRIYEITYVLHGWGLGEGYCVFSIREQMKEGFGSGGFSVKEVTDTLRMKAAADIKKMCQERKSCKGCVFHESHSKDSRICKLEIMPMRWRIKEEE